VALRISSLNRQEMMQSNAEEVQVQVELQEEDIYIYM
jgi:hypothetical protein